MQYIEDLEQDKNHNFLKVYTFLINLILNYLLDFPFTKVAKPLYLLFYNKIKDGYALVLMAPLVFISWIFASVVLIIINIPIILLGVICIVSFLYGCIFELASDFVNKNKGEYYNVENKVLTFVLLVLGEFLIIGVSLLAIFNY
jgi:hypothetical protein